jgi:hypothetical protein
MRSRERQVTERFLATIEWLGIPLATLDVRHFPMFEGLEPAYRR